MSKLPDSASEQPVSECSACQADAIAASDAEVQAFLGANSQWILYQSEGFRALKGAFKFSDFLSAFRAAEKVTQLAELYQHHPRLIVNWGSLEVIWWSHKLGNLHPLDLLLAAKTANLMRSSNPESE